MVLDLFTAVPQLDTSSNAFTINRIPEHPHQRIIVL